ncbi:MAG: RimK/LysX family protein [Maricaulaceae bacterium]|nr:RimK/LysX family protein [Maricaulaceae bacterium]
MKRTRKILTLGWREWAGLPELGVRRLRAKVDTGARTSAVHATHVRAFTRDGEDWVRFDLPRRRKGGITAKGCEARVHDRREVKSSTGHVQTRYVIRTVLSLGGHEWPIELTLARRDTMDYRLLIGREALARRAVVDPSKSYLLGKD